MKKAKMLFAVLAIIFAVASSFTIDQKSNFEEKWFLFNGTGDPTDADDYSLAPMDGANPGCPTSVSEIVCAIKADPDGVTPSKPDADDLAAIVLASDNFEDPVPALLEFVDE